MACKEKEDDDDDDIEGRAAVSVREGKRWDVAEERGSLLSWIASRLPFRNRRWSVDGSDRTRGGLVEVSSWRWCTVAAD